MISFCHQASFFLDKKALYLKNGEVEGELGKHIAADSRKKMKSDANNHY